MEITKNEARYLFRLITPTNLLDRINFMNENGGHLYRTGSNTGTTLRYRRIQYLIQQNLLECTENKIYSKQMSRMYGDYDGYYETERFYRITPKGFDLLQHGLSFPTTRHERFYKIV